jgi:hypothetical protein
MARAYQPRPRLLPGIKQRRIARLPRYPDPVWPRAAVLLTLVCACGAQRGPVVSAPAVPHSSGARPSSSSLSTSASDAPAACAQSWALEDAAGSSAQILVVCGNDVRREPVTAGAMMRALDPALEVAHERVCTCAQRVRAPAFVDLVITAVPAEGRASLEPSEPDASLDPDVAPGFLACVGSAAVSFEKFSADACDGQGATTYVYSLDVELAR